MRLRHKSFERPDEVREIEKSRVELVELGETVIGRTVFEPGWRWAEHVKPIVRTESCEVHHIGYVISGRLLVEMNDGATIELRGGDAFEVPPGHDAWVMGDEPWISVDFAGRRLFAKPPAAVAARTFATIVFTDLVQSTQRLQAMGDTAWRNLMADHNQAVRTEIERWGGREVATTGDGFLVVFESPANAVRAAASMLDAARSHGLQARAGIHTGEVEFQGDLARGIAVHAAARIISLAEADEVLVSGTVRDILAGSSLRFVDRGEHELRGIEGRRNIAALVR